MHPKLLLDVIRRQAGTLAKAILEGVMNSVDAGCTTCRVLITPDEVTIEDDGKGIMKRADVETFFETFGQPHDAKEGKVYGTFRMGRGQMFAFGVNTWRTGPFEMRVDVANRGLDYELETKPRPAAGCRITIRLYEPLAPSDLAETERTIRKWVRYAPGEVVVNGERANVPPADEAWDHVTPEAYVRLTGGRASLAVYNLGVHTMDFGGYRFGVGGVIVSRKQLRVNFARNDIQSDCPVWRRIKPLVDQQAREKLEKKKEELSDAERQRLADLITQGERPAGCREAKVFTAVNGRHHSAAQLAGQAHKYARKMAAAPLGHRVGDRILQDRVAFVMAAETLERFGMPLGKLVALVGELTDYEELYTAVDFEDVARTINDKFDLVPENRLSAIDRLWLTLAEGESYAFCGGAVIRGRRRIVVGRSDCGDGWTDGETYVAVNQTFLRKLPFDTRGVTDLALLLLHEFCHDGPDTGTHTHSQEFYEAFHSRAVEVVPGSVRRMLQRLPFACKRVERELPRAFLRHRDAEDGTVRALRKLLAAAEKLAATPAAEKPA